MSEGQFSGPEALYAASYRRLVRVVALACGSVAEAEDVVQEAFVRLIPRWSSVSRYEDPEGWVRMVALRLSRNRFRRAQNQLAALARLRHSASAPEPSANSVDVEAALKTLPFRQRQVVVLYYLVGLPIDELARVLTVPPGTVKSRLARARSALIHLLAEEIDSHA